MKQHYEAPRLLTEVLLKEDVLKISVETDNKYEKSNTVFKDKATLEGLL